MAFPHPDNQRIRKWLPDKKNAIWPIKPVAAFYKINPFNLSQFFSSQSGNFIPSIIQLIFFWTWWLWYLSQRRKFQIQTIYWTKKFSSDERFSLAILPFIFSVPSGLWPEKRFIFNFTLTDYLRKKSKDQDSSAPAKVGINQRQSVWHCCGEGLSDQFGCIF